jgi:hypothetical protein
MHAAAPFPVSGMLVMLGQTGLAVAASNTQTLLDVGAGTSGAEQVLAGDIAIGGSLPFASWLLPLSVATGSRLAVRIRSAVASKSCTMGMSLFGGGFGLPSGARGVTYGAVTTTGSRGTILSAPAAANTAEGAWTVITAATTAPARWLVVGVASPNNALAIAVNGFIDVGLGVAPETTVITDIPFAVSANEDINLAYPLTFPVMIPTGSRLVARYRGTSIATAASPSVTLTGIN